MKESPGRKIRAGRWESMTIRYQPRGVCARQFEIQAEDGIIQSVQVTGGCSGNLQGISSLLKGMSVQEAIQRMEGIRCGMKSTSCPDASRFCCSSLSAFKIIERISFSPRGSPASASVPSIR